jgi:hypothetical protein
MAHDNVPFIIARMIFEGNEADNKWNIPVKKNFPMLSRKDAVKELSKRHFHTPKSFHQVTQAFETTEPDY